jgi:hypothetical protein
MLGGVGEDGSTAAPAAAAAQAAELLDRAVVWRARSSAA